MLLLCNRRETTAERMVLGERQDSETAPRVNFTL